MSAGRPNLAGMTTTEDRVRALEVRVDKLETWSGPGQANALSTSLAATRAELATFRRETTAEFVRLRRELTTFRGEMTAELTSIRSDMQEILRRLPPVN